MIVYSTRYTYITFILLDELLMRTNNSTTTMLYCERILIRMYSISFGYNNNESNKRVSFLTSRLFRSVWPY